MNISLPEFKITVLDQLLAFLWRQWSALGVAGQDAPEERCVIDPEPLLLLSLTVCRYDARLFDEILDWLSVNSGFMNAQRLKNLLQQFDFNCTAELSAVAELLGKKSGTALKWKTLSSHPPLATPEPLFCFKDGKPLPLSSEKAPEFSSHGLLRGPLKLRGYSTPFPAQGTATLLLRLRALLGVNSRCELLCLLGASNEIHPADIARQTGYFARTTQNALAEMLRSGVVEMRTSNREKMYWLKPGLLDNLLRPDGTPTPWVNWSPLFRALEILWLGLIAPKRQKLDPLLLASELRRLTSAMRPLLGEAGWGMHLQNEKAYRGEEYSVVFMQDIKALLERLNHN
ncbi:hypothetical protein [Trichlorobacter ammonificans]|uniref:HTH arsR-type domain-containing protein n=1 Tax=Trichlorobacter ammonificans TaxID=2916410 RepID=A0ABM9DAG5_9BACT|nr:hypothetical protein [Trichlorobacter ammonificans]CAH2032188.1 conserved protein of unknown function [Trichlorobacter ammonificans]